MPPTVKTKSVQVPKVEAAPVIEQPKVKAPVIEQPVTKVVKIGRILLIFGEIALMPIIGALYPISFMFYMMFELLARVFKLLTTFLLLRVKGFILRSFRSMFEDEISQRPARGAEE